MKEVLERTFAQDGPFAARVPGFRLRSEQLEMSQAIGEAIERTGVLVAEAGTGTGKTFAYLVPALLAGGKVIVSTGTKTLQDQLFDRDLPAVRAALASGASIALLKGRANYVCLYRLRRAAHEGRFASRDEALQIRKIERFAAVSTTGDRAELADVPEDAPVWAHATSTRDNCLGQGCPDYKDCFVMRARRNALAADVVVVNHHLFFADLVLREEGISRASAGLQHRDLRRGAPAAGNRAHVLRRDRVERTAGRAGARRAPGAALGRRRVARARARGAAPGEGGARPAPGVRRAADALGVEPGAAHRRASATRSTTLNSSLEDS